MAAKTFDEFVGTYFTGEELIFDVGPVAEQWPHLVVKAGDKTAVIQLMNVAADRPDEQHLCIDVHSFVDGQAARSSVFGMEVGRRLEGFSDHDSAGTSHGMPGASLTAVLIGKQTDTDSSRVRWSRFADKYLADGGAYTLARVAATKHKPDGWYLIPASNEHRMQFMSADESTALERAGAAIAALSEHDTLMSTQGTA